METAVCTTSDVVTPNLYVWGGPDAWTGVWGFASLRSEPERLRACLYLQWSHREAVDRRTQRAVELGQAGQDPDRARQGGAVQSISAETDCKNLLRFYGWMAATNRPVVGEDITYMIREDLGDTAEECAQWLQNTQRSLVKKS